MRKFAFSRQYRNEILIACLVLFTFAISANIAWLNPNPDYVIKTNERVPIMWQYNGDAVVEFLSGAYFPEYFKIDKTRINRPTYPALVKILGEAYGIVAKPFIDINPLVKAMLGYVTLKLLVYLATALALYSIVKRYFNLEIALLSVTFLLLHPFAITFAGTFHTSELQFATPIFLIYLWLNLIDSYSIKKNILYSLIAGALMLAKQNYAVYIAILLASLFIGKKYKESILSLLIHLIPLALWLVTLHYLHIPYYNHETANGLGVWFIGILISGNLLIITKTIVAGVEGWFNALASFFNILLVAAISAFSFTENHSRFNRKEIIFVTLFIAMSLIQTVVAYRFNTYMTSDLSLLIFPLSAYVIYQIAMRFHVQKLLPVFLAIYLLIGLTTIVTLPWVHPYEHKGVTNPERVEELKEDILIKS